jgi:hypothetical protein
VVFDDQHPDRLGHHRVYPSPPSHRNTPEQIRGPASTLAFRSAGEQGMLERARKVPFPLAQERFGGLARRERLERGRWRPNRRYRPRLSSRHQRCHFRLRLRVSAVRLGVGRARRRRSRPATETPPRSRAGSDRARAVPRG